MTGNNLLRRWMDKTETMSRSLIKREIGSVSKLLRYKGDKTCQDMLLLENNRLWSPLDYFPNKISTPPHPTHPTPPTHSLHPRVLFLTSEPRPILLLCPQAIMCEISGNHNSNKTVHYSLLIKQVFNHFPWQENYSLKEDYDWVWPASQAVRK